MDTVSIVINLDTRPGFMEEVTSNEGNVQMSGTRSLDFLTHGVMNKVQFFEGYDTEVTVFVDVHEPVPRSIVEQWQQWQHEGIVDNIVLNKHTEQLDGHFFPKWNDISFMNAMMMARGKYLAHFDGDMAAFRNNKSIVDGLIGLLNEYDYVSYQSPWSPSPDANPSWDYAWVSTRFLLCHRNIIDYTEVVKCLRDADYLYGKYGEKFRRCDWTEHVLGIIAGKEKVFYPPRNNKWMMFSWRRYVSGTFENLNRMDYEKVLSYVLSCGGIQYPCDVIGR